MSIPNFTAMQAAKPVFESLQSEMTEVERLFETATDAAGRRAAVTRWDEIRARVGTWMSLVGLRFNQDTTSEAFKKDRDYRDALAPKLSNLNNSFKRKLLQSPHRAELEAAFGKQAFALWQQDARSQSPEVEKETIEISRLSAEYTEMLAGAKFEFRGETLTMPGLGKFTSDRDRDTRHLAQQLKWKWFEQNRPRLDEIFDQMTKLRHQSAQKLGLKDYIELGYLRMHRVDYNQADVDKLRKQVRAEVVPLCTELIKRQAAALGVSKIMHWDEGIHGRDGNPAPKGDHDWMVARATEMFDDMGHGLGEFFRLMTEKGLTDLKSRPGKAGGGFCTSFPAWGVPFIFANFNGTKGDVEVFTHEMGHAFQAYNSRNQKLADYLWPTHESAEIHSMSLEFLTWPWMDKFFQEQAAEFQRVHLIGSLLFIPYGTAVDHFQHLIYEKPDATPAQRHEMWREMEKTYLPWRDAGDLAHVAQGGFWQIQRHIYLSPFYYIDYVLAQVCALQFWVKADEDRPKAMQDYVKLCQRGGEAPFRELAKGAGLRSPFEEGCLSAVVAKARDWLAGQG